MKFSLFHGSCFIVPITLLYCYIKESSSDMKMGAMRMKTVLKSSGIVPDVIDVFPKKILQVEYENQREVAMGNNMTRWDTIEDPVKISYTADPKSYYTIIMTDPDCPSRENPIHREWQHWVLVNIPGAEWTQGFYLTDYIGILDVHRYVFLLFKQPGILNFTERVLDARPIELLRYKFSTKNFAEKYKFGPPVAINFFMSGEVPKRALVYKTTVTKTTSSATTSAVKVTKSTQKQKQARQITTTPTIAAVVEDKMTTTLPSVTTSAYKTVATKKTRRKRIKTVTSTKANPETDQTLSTATTVTSNTATTVTSRTATTVTQRTSSPAAAAAVIPPGPLIQYEDIPDVVPVGY
nr:PREDICTED: OV-16 antigen-like isoform X2 [Bemisia tabaci]